MGLILSIDVGTTNIKAALVDEDGRLCGEAKNIGTKIEGDASGRAEHDPGMLRQALLEICRLAVGSRGADVDGIALTSYQFGLILLYMTLGLGTNLFIATGFIRSIPPSLEEAARVDGASTWKIFWKIIFPLMSPINATIGILTALWAWNDFLLPLIVLTDQSNQTIPLAQYVFSSQFATNYPMAFSSYLMAMAPILIVYVFAQRWVVSGVMRGAVK